MADLIVQLFKLSREGIKGRSDGIRGRNGKITSDDFVELALWNASLNNRSLTAAQVAKHMKVSDDSARRKLMKLVRDGFARQKGERVPQRFVISDAVMKNPTVDVRAAAELVIKAGMQLKRLLHR
jgi:Fic family protein